MVPLMYMVNAIMDTAMLSLHGVLCIGTGNRADQDSLSYITGGPAGFQLREAGCRMLLNLHNL